MLQIEKQVTDILPDVNSETLKEAQDKASSEEKTMWKEK